MIDINNGQSNNDGTGQTLRSAFETVNDNLLDTQNQLNGKAPLDHTHTIDEIIGLSDEFTNIDVNLNDLQEQINNKADLVDTQDQINALNEQISVLNDMILQQNSEINELNTLINEILQNNK